MGQNHTWSESMKARWSQPNSENLHLLWEYTCKSDLQEWLKMLSVSCVTFLSTPHFCNTCTRLFPDHRLLNHAPSRALSCNRQSCRTQGWNKVRVLQTVPQRAGDEGFTWIHLQLALITYMWARKGGLYIWARGTDHALLCEHHQFSCASNPSALPPAPLSGGTRVSGNLIRAPPNSHLQQQPDLPSHNSAPTCLLSSQPV